MVDTRVSWTQGARCVAHVCSEVPSVLLDIQPSNPPIHEEHLSGFLVLRSTPLSLLSPGRL